MRLRALERRALSEGVSNDAVDDAMDGDDPKAALIALIVEAASSRGPSDRVLSALSTGGEAAVDALSAVLDHALDVLEQLSVSSPRKSRRSVLELMDATESLAESIDGAWCDGLSVCAPAELSALADVMASVRGLGAAARRRSRSGCPSCGQSARPRPCAGNRQAAAYGPGPRPARSARPSGAGPRRQRRPVRRGRRADRASRPGAPRTGRS